MSNNYHKFQDGYKPNHPLINRDEEVEANYYYSGYIIQLYKGGGVNISRKVSFMGMSAERTLDQRLKEAIKDIDKRIEQSERSKEEERELLIKKFTKFIDSELL